MPSTSAYQRSLSSMSRTVSPRWWSPDRLGRDAVGASGWVVSVMVVLLVSVAGDAPGAGDGLVGRSGAVGLGGVAGHDLEDVGGNEHAVGAGSEVGEVAEVAEVTLGGHAAQQRGGHLGVGVEEGVRVADRRRDQAAGLGQQLLGSTAKPHRTRHHVERLVVLAVDVLWRAWPARGDDALGHA